VVCAEVFRAAKAIADAAETIHAKRNCATGLKFLQSTAATHFSLDLSLFQFLEAKQIANARTIICSAIASTTKKLGRYVFQSAIGVS
jgi:hypothetical protein